MTPTSPIHKVADLLLEARTTFLTIFQAKPGMDEHEAHHQWVEALEDYLHLSRQALVQQFCLPALGATLTPTPMPPSTSHDANN